MATISNDQGSAYGYRDQASGTSGTSGTGASQAGRTGPSYSTATSGAASAGSTSGSSPTMGTTGTTGGAGASKAGGTNMDALLQSAQRLTSKVAHSQYTLPVAIGGAAFILGALASSRILRQIVLIASGYAVKYAIAHAPKEEILEFAKNFVKSSLAQPRAA